jgi:hypothetical protein
MPTCKNDPSKKYKGTEPSPKGLGWCAHAEKEDKVRKGKDGNQWIVKKVKNCSKRWVVQNKSNPSIKNLDKFLTKRFINEKDEEYISMLFSKNTKLRSNYTTDLLKKIATLPTKFKKNIKINSTVSICNQYTSKACIKFKLDEHVYDIYVTDYIKNIASMLVIKKQKCNINKLIIKKTKNGMESIGIVIIGNSNDINFDSNKYNLVYDKNNKNIYEIDLHGRQIDGTFPIYIGKNKKNTEAILIPLLNFNNDFVLSNIK